MTSHKRLRVFIILYVFLSTLGNTPTGVFYGIQTLLSLLSNSNQTQTLPGITIIDEPRFEYRGMHLDIARNFHPKETVMDLVDTMAQYKMNKLHLHLADDEAWRLEVPELPELTTVGLIELLPSVLNSCKGAFQGIRVFKLQRKTKQVRRKV